MVVFDASPLVDLFVDSLNSSRIRSYVAGELGEIVVSDLAAGEFSAGIARLVRTRCISDEHGLLLFGMFDSWRTGETQAVLTEAGDIRAATAFVRRFDLSLKLPDAIHIAIAQRLRAPLCTFDATQARAARRVGVPLVEVP
jgi:uncharacterized protein